MKNIRQLLSQRVTQVRKRLAKAGTSALLLTNDRDIRYLTGFIGEDSWALVLAKSPQVHILTDSRFIDHVKEEAPQARHHIRRKGLAEELDKLVKALRIRSILLQQNYLTVAAKANIVKKIKGVKWKLEDDGMLKQRAVKDEHEIGLIRKAQQIQQNAFETARKRFKIGMSEIQMAAELEYEIRAQGADGTSFNSIVAVDANAAFCHAIPGEHRRLKKNSTLLIDWGAKYKGYCSDMTRVLFFGKPPKKLAEMYQIASEAHSAGIAAIKPGVELKAVDWAARDIIKKAGYGKYFGHGLGHGIGLNIHEQPNFSQASKGVLEVGQVVTVEPGIYIGGLGGVRIEDDVIVTEKGYTVIGHLPKTLEWAMM